MRLRITTCTMTAQVWDLVLPAVEPDFGVAHVLRAAVVPVAWGDHHGPVAAHRELVAVAASHHRQATGFGPRVHFGAHHDDWRVQVPALVLGSLVLQLHLPGCQRLLPTVKGRVSQASKCERSSAFSSGSCSCAVSLKAQTDRERAGEREGGRDDRKEGMKSKGGAQNEKSAAGSSRNSTMILWPRLSTLA